MGYVLNNSAPPDYYAQMQFILMVTERTHANFISYNPRLAVPLDYLHIRYDRDEDMIDKMRQAAIITVGELQGLMRKYDIKT